MFEPTQRLAVAVGASLTAGTMVMFWSLRLALQRLAVNRQQGPAFLARLIAQLPSFPRITGEHFR